MSTEEKVDDCLLSRLGDDLSIMIMSKVGLTLVMTLDLVDVTTVTLTSS
jgi:hypothetical protein